MHALDEAINLVFPELPMGEIFRFNRKYYAILNEPEEMQSLCIVLKESDIISEPPMIGVCKVTTNWYEDSIAYWPGSYIYSPSHYSTITRAGVDLDMLSELGAKALYNPSIVPLRIGAVLQFECSKTRPENRSKLAYFYSITWAENTDGKL